MNDIDPKNIQPFLRICIILFLVMAVYAVIGIKLWHIQVLSGNKYTAKTSRQYARKIRIPAVRGRIFSSDGNLLAENRASYDVVFHLSEMRKPGRMSKTVNHIMGELARVSDSLGRRCEVTVMDIRHHMNYYPGRPITVFKDLNPAELAKVSELTPVVEGMEVTVETARHYPYGSLASHLIGYVGPSDPSKANDRNEFFYYIPDTIGKSGVESLYDDKLKGSPGKKLVLVNHRGFVHEVVGVPIPARNGFDLELTIDSRAQYLAERLLGDSNGAIVLLDASDGAVLAMASTPGFDPNLFVPRISSAEYSKLQENPDKPFLNKAAQGSYMPGSIAKPLVGISMLENGISPDHKIVCDGFTMIGTSRIRCWIWYAGGHGPVDLLRGLEISCNDFFIENGMQLGVDKLSATFASAGIGSKTGFPLSESAGLLPSRNQNNRRWNVFDTALVSIGQGRIEVTPLQAARYTAAIANGGTLWKPYLLKTLRSTDSAVIQTTAPEANGKLAASPHTLELIRRGMHRAVNAPGGGAKQARNSKIELSGKTGTAEVGSRENRYKNTWFTGFGTDPKTGKTYAITVMVMHGVGGGKTAAPLASRFFEQWL